MLVRPAVASDEAAWRRLWQGYVTFYQSTVPEAVTAATWARALDPTKPILCRVAEHEGAVVGFTNLILHEGTWETAPVCYLEDLFVDPTARGLGVGRALIEAVRDEAVRAGWSRVYWQTAESNHTARALYDKLATLGDWRRYDLDLPPRPAPL